MKITIKYGKSYEDTWAVFEGSTPDIRAEIIDYFGMDPATQQGLSLSSVVVNATQVAHGKGLIATALGATVIEETIAEPAKPAGDPWAAASAQQAPSAWSSSASVPALKAEDPNAWILGEIAKKATVDELKKLWAANQSFFADAAVMAAWKAKGKALSAG
ncbi:hypothetical protein OH733_05525 [Streptomyces griseus]|uniref:hypothetical protein n=1 Tax=Streptomyces griseus TaxID=1911 RepID=UPI0038684F46|nr:hypothetical protein OH733_05525 [Streptomyces griseus]WTD71150.1 hypothetical protein OH763_31460 [Streptomyces griseus]